MIESLNDLVELHNGLGIPQFGLGVWRSEPGTETEDAVRWALEAGYHHIDTAAVYKNEESVGKAIAASGVAREDIFVTTKLWNDSQGYDRTLKAFQKSLDRLGLDYVDLYLIHWPKTETMKESWRALESIYADGRAKAIGVSNFLVHHLEALLDGALIVPMVNQVEFHPRLQQPALLDFDRAHGIVHEAWSPIMKGQVVDIPELQTIGKKYGKSPVHVSLRWELQKGVVTIPKSVHQKRIVENAAVYDFELSDEDMAMIDGLDREERVGPHPDEITF